MSTPWHPAVEPALAAPRPFAANVTLELSLKPFTDATPATMRRVIATLLEQWRPLYREAEQVSFLLWSSDGTELLDYNADLDATFDPARYIGRANSTGNVDGDPEGLAIHSKPYLYRDGAGVFTYRWLQELVATMKSLGRELSGKRIRVGTTFDPGPEFALSDFKYARHPEICLGKTMGRASFACCYTSLHAEARSYAGFPQGIEEGLSFGTFLGRQTQHFTRDLGFDYVWFSNGFGFGMETWALNGALFDGTSFDTQKSAAGLRAAMLEFWTNFRRECPNLPVETRGTNLSSGIDLSSDAVPLKDIYRDYGIVAPPNSPWAAINGDLGLELMGWMSHIAELPPTGTFPFRFYIHDPWFLNSPWLDRYCRQPHDIYLPLSVARLDAEARVQDPDSIEFLTVDDSRGRMPDQVPLEVIPHIQEAWRSRPDTAGPFVWIYPFDLYHAWTFDQQERIGEPFFGDWLIRNAINDGFPLNTVISEENFARVSAQNAAALATSILVTHAPAPESATSRLLLRHVQNGGKAILYGSLVHSDPKLREALSLQSQPPLAGELRVTLSEEARRLGDVASYSAKLVHIDSLSGGGLTEALRQIDDASTAVLAKAENGAGSRALSVLRRDPAWAGGALGWIRGSINRGAAADKYGHIFHPQTGAESFPTHALFRTVVSALGYEVSFRKRLPGDSSPIQTLARHRNSYRFSGYQPNATVETRLRLPLGCPLFIGTDTLIESGRSVFRFSRAWRHECRLFVDQPDGVVSVTEIPTQLPWRQRSLLVRGLIDATLRFLPDTAAPAAEVSILRQPRYPYLTGEFLPLRRTESPSGPLLETSGVSGDVLIAW